MNSIIHGLRQTARHLYLDVAGSISKPAPGIHIMNGHRVQDEPQPDTFRHLLHTLAHEVDFVKVEKAVEMIATGVRPDKPVLAFTFDDGFMECYDCFAPVLEEFGINALFFINPNYVDGDEQYIAHFNNQVVLTPNKRPMRWSHIAELSERGHIIGAHTMDHYMINSGDADTLKYQIEGCKPMIEAHIGKACEYFAIPFGKLTHANLLSVDIATRCYKYVFSQSDYRHYFSFDGRVINRRHFEPFWPVNHVRYFISCNKT